MGEREGDGSLGPSKAWWAGQRGAGPDIARGEPREVEAGDLAGRALLPRLPASVRQALLP